MVIDIIRGNALALPQQDASVDLVVTSPPYFGLRSYTDDGQHYDGQLGAEATPREFVDALIATTAEMVRVLKPTGSLWVNLGDKYVREASAGLMRPKSLMGIPWRYALRCIDDLRLILRAEVIWSKPNGLPESVTDRVRRSHETWFHLVRQPCYYANVDSVREATGTYKGSTPTPLENRSGAAKAPRNVPMSGTSLVANPLGKLPASVWTIPSQPLHIPEHLGVDHYAAFPMEWPRRIIQGWSPPGGVVLDPFGGTGTTALVAYALGRHGISVDLSEDYCRIARWRTTDAGQLAAAMQVTKPEPAPQDMDSLLDLI